MTGPLEAAEGGVEPVCREAGVCQGQQLRGQRETGRRAPADRRGTVDDLAGIRPRSVDRLRDRPAAGAPRWTRATAPSSGARDRLAARRPASRTGSTSPSGRHTSSCPRGSARMSGWRRMASERPALPEDDAGWGPSEQLVAAYAPRHPRPRDTGLYSRLVAQERLEPGRIRARSPASSAVCASPPMRLPLPRSSATVTPRRLPTSTSSRGRLLREPLDGEVGSVHAQDERGPLETARSIIRRPGLWWCRPRAGWRGTVP